MGKSIKYFGYFFLALTFLSSCKTSQSYSQTKTEFSPKRNTYSENYNRIISFHEKYPDEVAFAKSYLQLTEGVINLSDSLLDGLVRNGMKESTFAYFSKNKNGQRLYSGLQEIYSSGTGKLIDLQKKEKLRQNFATVIACNKPSEWIEKTFKDKAMIEAIADIRQYQTNCLEALDLVFEEVQNRISGKQ